MAKKQKKWETLEFFCIRIQKYGNKLYETGLAAGRINWYNEIASEDLSLVYKAG